MQLGIATVGTSQIIYISTMSKEIGSVLHDAAMNAQLEMFAVKMKAEQENHAAEMGTTRGEHEK